MLYCPLFDIVTFAGVIQIVPRLFFFDTGTFGVLMQILVILSFV